MKTKPLGWPAPQDSIVELVNPLGPAPQDASEAAWEKEPVHCHNAVLHGRGKCECDEIRKGFLLGYAAAEARIATLTEALRDCRALLVDLDALLSRIEKETK